VREFTWACGPPKVMETLLLAGESARPTLAAVGQALSPANPASSTESVIFQQHSQNDCSEAQ
jgi:hypothetical protein